MNPSNGGESTSEAGMNVKRAECEFQSALVHLL